MLLHLGPQIRDLARRESKFWYRPKQPTLAKMTLGRPRVYHLIVAFSVLSSCGRAPGPGSETIEVPEDSKIPHREAGLFDLSVTGEVISPEADVPLGIKHLLAYFADSSGHKIDSLRYPSSGRSTVRWHSESRVLILDKRSNTLLDYDLAADTAHVVARFGRGPGELAFSQDLEIQGDTVRVAREDRHLVVFHCPGQVGGSCRHTSTIRLDLGPRSLTSMPNGEVALLGYKPSSYTDGIVVPTDSMQGHSVVIMRRDGSTREKFGSLYRSEGHWMLMQDLTRGHVVHLPALGFLVAFDRFPHVYLYHPDGRFARGWTLPGFTVGRQSYWPGTGFLEGLYTDHDLVSDLYQVGSSWVLVEVTRQSNRARAEFRTDWRTETAYYGLEVGTSRIVSVGTSSTSIRLVPGPGGTILEADGAYWRFRSPDLDDMR